MKRATLTALLALTSVFAHAHGIDVKDAWVRSAVPGQSGTGAFMSITAKDGAKLVGASSPVAGVTEVHEMKMDGDVMRMRAVPALDLPAGITVQLKPGGYHVMLFELPRQFRDGERFPLTLRFEKAGEVEVAVAVQKDAPATAPHGHDQGAGHDH